MMSAADLPNNSILRAFLVADFPKCRYQIQQKNSVSFECNFHSFSLSTDQSSPAHATVNVALVPAGG
ncbi:hypothetical protein AGR1B_Cc120507 [Agrobacterium fabacearum S56]|nr:hypothetical protein AGR1B_Cc120507 [Agrobacterium fabacearum S56]